MHGTQKDLSSPARAIQLHCVCRDFATDENLEGQRQASLISWSAQKRHCNNRSGDHENEPRSTRVESRIQKQRPLRGATVGDSVPARQHKCRVRFQSIREAFQKPNGLNTASILLELQMRTGRTEHSQNAAKVGDMRRCEVVGCSYQA